MIQLSKSGSTVTFTFDENSGYLQNGTINVPVNSLSLILDESNMATFRKSASNDIFVSANIAEFGMSKSELEAWYKANMVSSGGGGGGGVTPEEVQGMIDESISGLAESSAVTLEISEATSGKVDADSLATVATSGSYNDLLDKPTIPTVPTDVSAFNNDAGYATSGYVDSEVSGKVDTSSVVTAVTSASTDSEIPTAKAVYDAIPSGGGATYIAGDGISIDTANTITAVFDGVYGHRNVYNELTDVNEAIYVIVPYDCEDQTDGAFSLVVDGNDFVVHVDSSSGDYSVDESEVDWTEYFSITWDSTKKLFLIDPFEGSFESLNDEGCVRFTYPDDVELKYSGTTSNAIKEAFKGLENLDNKVNNKVDFVEFELVSGDVYTISGDVANKQDTLVSGTNIKTINNQSLLGSGNIDIQGGGGSGSSTVELTQAEYDALVTGGTVDPTTYYIITDATPIDMSNYYTSAQTESAISAATSGLQETLVSGTNIKTINNESILGSGNITIQGGGGVDSGTVQTMIDESISGKVDTSSVTTSVTSASTDSEIPTAKAVYDAVGQGGGATYSGGSGINIDIANTISAVYDGWHGERVQILENISTPFYLYKADDCGAYQGTFSVTFIINDVQTVVEFNVSTHTYTFIEGDSSWEDYVTVEWDASGCFKATPNTTINVMDSSCARFSKLYFSGTTENAIDGTLDRIEYIKANGFGNNIEFTARDVENDLFIAPLTLNGVYPVQRTVSFSGGIKSIDGKISTQMQSTPYKWMSGVTIGEYETSTFNTPSSAITFNISRNPSEYLYAFDAYGYSYVILDSNGDNPSPSDYSVVIVNGSVTVSALSKFKYITKIADSQGELSQYVSDVQYWGYEVDTIPNVVAKKVDTSSITSAVTSASTDSEIPTAKAVYDATQGGGGGGTTYSAGTNISIENDTISCTLPITKNFYNNGVTLGWNGNNSKNYYAVAEGYNSIASGGSSHAEGHNTTAATDYSHSEGDVTKAGYKYGDTSHTTAHAEGYSTSAFSYCSHAEGGNNIVKSNYSHVEGYGNKINNLGDYSLFALGCSHVEGMNNISNNASEHASGQFNVSSSASTTFGDSGNTLFSVGNGTADNARHNAFEVRQNGDIYLSLNGQDVKLQDNLGGSVSSAVTTSVTSASTDSEIPTAKAVYDAVGQGGGGGGTTYSAGRGISIAYDNVIQLDVPVYKASNSSSAYIGSDPNYPNNVTGENSFAVGLNNLVSGKCSMVVGGFDGYGDGNSATTMNAYAFGRNNLAKSFCSFLNGYGNISSNYYEYASGRFNNSVSASTTWGNSGNTLFSVGNGTSSSARHNAFEIRQNGDIYITSGGTDIKLQDNLGGGSVSSAVTSGDTNAVSSDAVYTAMGGLKLQQITQADYDALVSGGTVDASTLYIITNVVN